jgi:hypothetical protein
MSSAFPRVPNSEGTNHHRRGFRSSRVDPGLEQPARLPGGKDAPYRVASIYDRDRKDNMEFVIGGVLYFILLVTLGVITIRKGHWVMFVIGIFIPLFWIIGALMPPRQPA